MSIQITSKEKRTIDYTSYDFDELRTELIQYLNETQSFKDAQYVGSNIRTLVDLIAYIGSLFGYYINSSANEVFIPTAKRYSNLNKISQLLRYDPRGTTSAKVDVTANLSPEYVFGKENEYVEIPSYSQFPSERQTESNQNFYFTNPNSIVYMIKGYGITPIDSHDITYAEYPLPFVAPAEFFSRNITNSPAIDPTKIKIPLSATKQLRVIQPNDAQNYRRFDTNYPIKDLNVSNAGQPFQKTINTVSSTLISANQEFYLIMEYDIALSAPKMSTSLSNPTGNEDNRICTLILEPTDSTNSFYRLRVDDMYTYRRFYVGTLGIGNLETTKWKFETFPEKTSAVKKVILSINEDGVNGPLSVLINGKIYNFNSDIQTKIINKNYFSPDVDVYNVNLCIDTEESELTNHGAYLDITTNDPVDNQVTIAKIYTKAIDDETNSSSMSVDFGSRNGDFELVEKPSITTSEQKGGRAFISQNQETQQVLFNNPFQINAPELTVEYHIALTADNNVRTWYTNADENGFIINVEPNSSFEGYVNWVATRVIQDKVKEIDIVFETPITSVITQQTSSYMVQLTPSDNVEVWYGDQTPNGFKIYSEREFEGKISWSTFVYSDTQEIIPETNTEYRQRGTVFIENAGAGVPTIVSLPSPMPNNTYAIQLVSSKNVKVWYTNKAVSGFQINVENNVTDTIRVDWYVDVSNEYIYQKHGEVQFKGTNVTGTTIPGLTFDNIPESFEINELVQGIVRFTYINYNGIIDSTNNFLSISLDPTRISENDLTLIIRNETISSNGIRVFVKNDYGTWDEWQRAGVGYNTPTEQNSLCYMVKTNPDKYITVEFGDGINWGSNPYGKEILVIGLESVGKQGNIGRNVLSSSVVISKYILGNDETNIKFQKSFMDLLGLKSREFFNGNNPDTEIIDSEKTRLSNSDLSIKQNKNAFGGNEVETVEELRKNSVNYFIRRGRNVSLDDHKRFIQEVFSDYIIKARVLSYKEMEQENMLPPETLSKYWFNHIFIVALNKDGSNYINKNLRDFIIEQLSKSSDKMLGAEYQLLVAKWVPVDVIIRYKKTRFGNSDNIETTMRKNIKSYFEPINHELGQTVRHSDILNICNIENVDYIEVMLNKDPNGTLNPYTYNINIVDSFVTEKQAEEVRRNKLMELVAKDPSLVKVFQPLFDTFDLKTGKRDWSYSLDISFGKNEFPKLNDIIIERDI